MTKAERTKIKTNLERRGIHIFPDGDYILRIERYDYTYEYSLRHRDHSTVAVDRLDNILDLCD